MRTTGPQLLAPYFFGVMIPFLILLRFFPLFSPSYEDQSILMPPQIESALPDSPISDPPSDHPPSQSRTLPKTKCGYIAVLGRANAGKSTLINALIGAKIMGVSRKPETTRHRILGIHSTATAQLLFLDTPGLCQPKTISHHQHSKDHEREDRSSSSSSKTPASKSLTLAQFLRKGAMSALGDADILLYLIDITAGFTDRDSAWLQGLLPRLSHATKVQLLLSKNDRVTKSHAAKIEEQTAQHLGPLWSLDTHRWITTEAISFSSKKPNDVKSLRELCTRWLPPSEFLYEKGSLSDRGDEFIIAEIVREQIFRGLGQELPYSTRVKASTLRDTGQHLYCDVTLVVGKKSHKGMLIGKKGHFLKTIGKDSREILERHFKRKLVLKLWVRVEENWQRKLHPDDDFTL